MFHDGKCAVKTDSCVNRFSEKGLGVKKPTNSCSAVFASPSRPSRIGGKMRSCGSCSFVNSMDAAANEGQINKLIKSIALFVIRIQGYIVGC